MIALISIFLLLVALLRLALSRILSFEITGLKGNLEKVRLEYERLEKVNQSLKNDNRVLEEGAESTIALYDITKDICKSLDDQKVFATFKEKINRYIRVNDCKLLGPQEDISKYQDYTILPLDLYKKTIGFLAAKGIRVQDTDKFHILSQQFLLGLKRALLYKEVQELTITDTLTQVFTRRYFMERFNEEIQRAKKFKHKFSFLMIDVDRFKEFNDHYGHLVGDAILREVSKAVKESIRQIDLIGRYGGEEISIVLSETDKDQARFAAERIRRSIESRHIKAYDEELRATVSIGIATFPTDANDGKPLIEKADQALYLAKEAGRNRICLYQPS
jgi:diguanylate cyclase (GGDEF)-like protein